MSANPPAHAAQALRIAGLPFSVWAFGLRNWLAMIGALYAAFWLQLATPETAAFGVGLLALPTRGQARQKGVYCLLGTGVGIVLTIAVAGLAAGFPSLYVGAGAICVSTAIFVAGLLDGNRAYGAVISGYTVALVAFGQIDTPQNVFSAALDRGANLAVGAALITAVNDIFAAPDVHDRLYGQLVATFRKLREFGARSLEGGPVRLEQLADLLRELTAYHPDVTTLPLESVSGRARGAAARAAVVGMLREAIVTRAAADMLSSRGEAGRSVALALARRLTEGSGEAEPSGLDDLLSPGSNGISGCCAHILLEQVRMVEGALADMRSGSGARHGFRLALYRSRRSALRSALRAFLVIVIASTLFALAGLSAASYALGLVCALTALSTTNPRPRVFAQGALIGMPIAVAVGGIVQFLVLDGSDEFAQLAIAMAPVVIGASIVLSRAKPPYGAAGFIVLVFFSQFLAPSNPQTYNPQTYVTDGALAIIGVAIFYFCLSAVLPTTDAMRRGWALKSARVDLRDAIQGRWRRLRPGAIHRDADRIGQIAGFDYDGALKSRDLAFLLGLSNIEAAIRRISLRLEEARPDADIARAARAALDSLDETGLRRVATMGFDRARRDASPTESGFARELLFAAELIARGRAEIEGSGAGAFA